MSERKPENPPAFPTFETVDGWDRDSEKYREHVVPVGGMSLRDYFAAHAPTKPQRWFQPVMPLPRPEAIFQCSGTTAHSQRCHYEYCSEKNWKELADWDTAYVVATLKQWPYAWADAMLAERSKP